MNIDPQDIQVSLQITNNKGNMLARANVLFFGVINTKGWRVMKSEFLHPILQEEINIISPSAPNGQRWYEIVFIEDIKLHQLVVEKIYSHYLNKKLSEGSEKVPEMISDSKSKEVSDDIPF